MLGVGTANSAQSVRARVHCVRAAAAVDMHVQKAGKKRQPPRVENVCVTAACSVKRALLRHFCNDACLRPHSVIFENFIARHDAACVDYQQGQTPVDYNAGCWLSVYRFVCAIPKTGD